MKESAEQAKDLTILGSKSAIPEIVTSKTLETFPNANPDRLYTITFASDEFLSHCPKTGQPDFASYEIKYIAGKDCVESKSLKLYMQSWMHAPGAFMEFITNTVLSDLVEAIKPLGMVVTMNFKARGGITTKVRAHHIGASLVHDHLEATPEKIRKLLDIA